VQDITYIWTSEGWLYLAIVIDLYSRKVVGWSMGSRMKAQRVCDALTMAMWQRRPKAGLLDIQIKVFNMPVINIEEYLGNTVL
jgi:transposase InsO family protein